MFRNLRGRPGPQDKDQSRTHLLEDSGSGASSSSGVQRENTAPPEERSSEEAIRKLYVIAASNLSAAEEDCATSEVHLSRYTRAIELLRNLAEEQGVKLSSRPENRNPQPVERRGMSYVEFGMRWGYSKRYVEILIKEGLPTVMDGKARRVDVERADVWLREHRGRKVGLKSEIEEEARRDARHSRRRGTDETMVMARSTKRGA